MLVLLLYITTPGADVDGGTIPLTDMATGEGGLLKIPVELVLGTTGNSVSWALLEMGPPQFGAFQLLF